MGITLSAVVAFNGKGEHQIHIWQHKIRLSAPDEKMRRSNGFHTGSTFLSWFKQQQGVYFISVPMRRNSTAKKFFSVLKLLIITEEMNNTSVRYIMQICETNSQTSKKKRRTKTGPKRRKRDWSACEGNPWNSAQPVIKFSWQFGYCMMLNTMNVIDLPSRKGGTATYQGWQGLFWPRQFRLWMMLLPWIHQWTSSLLRLWPPEKEPFAQTFIFPLGLRWFWLHFSLTFSVPLEDSVIATIKSNFIHESICWKWTFCKSIWAEYSLFRKIWSWRKGRDISLREC